MNFRHCPIPIWNRSNFKEFPEKAYFIGFFGVFVLLKI